ncbi:hypothetical protein ACGF3G_43085 [Streptomyces sp. NPDC048179]|uniref:hypothetical protein n=1 Tax=Streptomyces sp. NPDC048179 TaxID=3365506 RepID=UPI003712CC66
MADETHQFCKIFVQKAEPQAVAEQLASLLGAQLQRRTLDIPEAVVEVRKNPDAGMTDEFLGWPVVIEIDAGSDTLNEAIVSLATRIVTSCWQAGTPVVAACDYESELPWCGGIGRLKRPRE